MKRILFALLLSVALFGCTQKTEQTLPLRSYVCLAEEPSSPDVSEESKKIAAIMPHITLEEDNRFTFAFSAISSYIARGKYEIKNDRLILKTDDGLNYEYGFDIKDEQLIFDAGNSSEQTWYADIPDGAVFN